MKYLTIARKATLGSDIRERLLRCSDTLMASKDGYLKIVDSYVLDKRELGVYESSVIIRSFTEIECLVSDILIDFLICYPGHLENKDISIVDLSENHSVQNAIRVRAQKTVTDWSHGRFERYLDKAISILNKKARIDADLIERMKEIKATRDILVHNGGRHNNLYEEKAGKYKRKPDFNEYLEISKDYILASIDTMHRFADDFKVVIPEKILNHTKVDAFKEMWNDSHLADRLSFDEAWLIRAIDDIAEPRDILLNRYWSHSEKPLVDFFLGIYSPTHPKREYRDILYILSRWPTTRKEGKMISSWIENPFWF
jgi:hypothetical protein